MTTIVAGAPSLTGKTVTSQVAAAFIAAVYPLKITVTNLTSKALSFPEVDGLYIGPGSGTAATVTIKNADMLQRLASSIEFVAEANAKAVLLELTDAVAGTLLTAPDSLLLPIPNKGVLSSGDWFPIPSTFRLLFNGTGLVGITSLSASGVLVVDADFSISAESNVIRTYSAEDTTDIKVVFPSTITIKLLG